MTTQNLKRNISKMQMNKGFKLFLLTVLIIQTPAVSQAQKLELKKDFKNLFQLEVDEPEGLDQDIEFDVRLSADEMKKGSTAILSIKATIPEGFHLYSQKKTNISPTIIKIIESTGLKAIDSTFTPDQEPRVTYDSIMKKNYEDFEGNVIWTKKYRIEDPENASLKGNLSGQYCSSGKNGRCIPIRPPYQFSPKLELSSIEKGSTTSVVTASETSSKKLPFIKSVRPTRTVGDQEKPDPVELTFRLEPENAQPGEEVTLSVQAKFDGKWHTYGLKQNPEYYGKPTVILVDGLHGLKPISNKGFQPNHPPEKEKPFEDEEAVQLVHHDEVTWTKKYEVLPDGKDGNYGLAGSISYQVCLRSCLPYKKINYELGDVSRLTPVDNQSPANSGVGQELVNDLIVSDVDEDRGLLSYLFFAFLGGMILNVMPCVLPVLAIKVMSFVQQAGESRSRIFLLNLVYAAGVIFVFLVLASLAVFLQKGWGGLFQSTEFNIVMACLVFGMGLSLLGVFEIPIPGVIGSAAGSQQKEGLPGAFLTGIFATLLATPCSGPFLGTVLGWSVKQPAYIIYLIWGTIGLGMATPYVVFGLFPNAIKFLPKPGMWMVRFKEFCGFVLMGTLIFIINFIDQEYTMTLLILLLGIALALWMIGNLYDVQSPPSHKKLVRFSAAILFISIAWFGFAIQRKTNDLPWENFSEARLVKLLENEKTVLIDFTADWCTNCKVNEKFALNTKRTKTFLENNDIVPLYADYTDESEEIKKWLDKFKSISVPLTVIINPGKQPLEPVILRDLYSQTALLKGLNQAVQLSENVEPSSKSAKKTGETVHR